MADKGWQRKFEDPIPLPDGRKLVTLRDAADYITRLPKKESDLPEWQTAIEVLMLVPHSGPTMLARIGVMKALNRHVERVFNSERKDTHWGKRKLKRDQCANLGGGDSLADLGIERPRCGAGIRRDRPLFSESVPVSERKTICTGKNRHTSARHPTDGAMAPLSPRRALGQFHFENEKPGSRRYLQTFLT